MSRGDLNQGCFTDRFPQFKPLLSMWIKIQKQYCKERDWKDATWWYNERASISILAGAAWKIGEFALEEYSTEKLRPVKNSRLGRQDLLLRIKSVDFVAESKYYRPSLDWTITEHRRSLDYWMMEATNAAMKKNAYGARKLAIVFADPALADRYMDETEQLIARWHRFVSSFRRGAVAWYNLPRKHWLKWKRWYHPGSAVFISPVRRG